MRRRWPELLFALAVLSASMASASAGREETDLRRSQAAIGRAVGNWQLLDQRSRPVEFAQLNDKPLVVNFVYTGCFQVCPATTQFLKAAVASAREAVGAHAFRVVSIGFNQPFDGPEALAEFAQRQRIDDPEWLFVAPREQDVDALLQRFGMTVQRTPSGFDHLIQASIVDPRGVIVQQVYGDKFELPMLINPLKQALSGQATEALSVQNIWTKVRLYCTVYDPYTGKYKLDYSLFFELFAGVTTLGAMVWFLVRELHRT
jgi:protein SCO1/2